MSDWAFWLLLVVASVLGFICLQQNDRIETLETQREELTRALREEQQRWAC